MTEPVGYPEGYDTIWLGADHGGQVAAFFTAGFAPIPVAVLVQLETFDFELEILKLPKNGSAKLLVDYPKDSSFRAIAERGLYVFDWSDIHRTHKHHTSVYELVAMPENPIQLLHLPSIVSQAVTIFETETFVFEKSQSVDVSKFFKCLASNKE
jgi:hypothetical protein